VATVVARANLAYFFIEYAVARRIGSVSLFADSVDFLEDAGVSFLVVAALGWSACNRARVGMLLVPVLLSLRSDLRANRRGAQLVSLRWCG
jgi:divalent metal cation (Fe/Co/Zn/Cd) transporter